MPKCGLHLMTKIRINSHYRVSACAYSLGPGPTTRRQQHTDTAKQYTRTFFAGLPKRFFLRAVDPSNRPIRLSDSGVAAISEKRCASYSSAA